MLECSPWVCERASSDWTILGAALTVNDAVAALAAFPRPVIGAINGVAITGGLELALARGRSQQS